MSAPRGARALQVAAYWAEPGYPLTGARRARLEAALARTARLAGVDATEGQTAGVADCKGSGEGTTVL